MHEGCTVDGRFELAERIDSHGRTVPACRPTGRLVGVLPSEPGTVAAMSRRIEIELTSALPDGSWTWRAAGARKPNGLVPASMLPADAAVGDLLKVEIEQMLDGIEVQSVMKPKEKSANSNVLELLPSEKPFEAVIETRARRERSERRDGRDDRGKRDGRRDGKRDGRRDGARDGGARDGGRGAAGDGAKRSDS
jgi:hypothetical protein